MDARFGTLFACALALAIPLAAPAQAAEQGTIAGKVQRLPKGKGRTTILRVVELETGAVDRTLKVRKARYKVDVPAGVYLLAARSATLAGNTRSRTTKLLRVRKGKVVRRNVALAKTKSKSNAGRRGSRRRGSRRRARTRAAASADRFILGVDQRITITGLEGYDEGLPVDELVIHPIVENRPCLDGSDYSVVEIRRRPEVVDEIERSNGPLFDRETAVPRGRLLEAEQLIQGSGRVANGRLSFQLHVVDVASGQVIAGSSVEGAIDGATLFALIDQAAGDLMRDLCRGTIDVTFTGSGHYRRDEGPDQDSEHHIDAGYNWSITYQDVPLEAAGAPFTFASLENAGGEWSDNGRFGADGPGNFSCSGQAIGFNQSFAMAGVEKMGEIHRLTAMPFSQLQPDSQATACTGLPSPPYGSFYLSGSEVPNQAIVDFDPAALAFGPITLNAGPTQEFPPNCARILGDVTNPCSESLSWSGIVTISRSGG